MCALFCLYHKVIIGFDHLHLIGCQTAAEDDDVYVRWSANSVIGPPRVYPRYGDIHGAWAQGNITEAEFIIVCHYVLLWKSDQQTCRHHACEF